MFGTGSISDPFVLPNNSKTITMANRDVTTKVIADPRGVAGEVTLCMIVAGDSMAGGYHQSSYSVVNPAKVLQLNVFDGAIYRASDTLLGHSYWPAPNNRSWLPECADLLIAAGKCDRVVWVPISIGATLMSEWATDLNTSIVVAKKRAEAQGLTVNGALMQCGSNDVATTSAAYLSAAEACIDKAALGVPWLWAKTTYNTANGPLSQIRAAMDTLMARPDVFPGPDTDDLTGSSRWDNVHFNASGCSATAARWKSAIIASL